MANDLIKLKRDYLLAQHRLNKYAEENGLTS